MSGVQAPYPVPPILSSGRIPAFHAGSPGSIPGIGTTKPFGVSIGVSKKLTLFCLGETAKQVSVPVSVPW